jgi:hypothetical protein
MVIRSPLAPESRQTAPHSSYPVSPLPLSPLPCFTRLPQEMIFILTAKYIQREALEIFFGKLFPDGDAEVDVGAASRELITH